ncbi:MAG: hypothetical protein WC659_06975 [Patescibacteria group bacterium]
MKNKRQVRKEVMPFRRSLFWDVDPKTIDPEKHAEYIIERVLDFGELEEVRWLAHHYSKRLIRKTLKESRVIHDKSRILWDLVFK